MNSQLSKLIRFTLMLFTVFTMNTHLRAATVNLPTKTGSYISWNDATGSNFTVENNGANVGSTGKNTVLSFTINNSQQQDYLLTFKTGSKMEAELKMTLTHTNGNIVLSKNVVIENTNNWTPSIQHNYVLEQLQTGTYTLKFTVTKTTGNYAGNWGDLAFYTLNDIETIPGKLDLSKGNYGGGVVDEGANVGYIKDGGVATYSFKNTQEGVYSLVWEVARYSTGGNIDIIVKNPETEEIEAQTTYTLQSDAPSTYVPVTISLPGEISKGLHDLTFRFSGGSGYICNYRNLEMRYYAQHLAIVNGISIEGQNVTNGVETDWQCNLPANYNSPTTTFKVEKAYGTVSCSAEDLEITDHGDGTFTFPTPEKGKEVIIHITLTPDEQAGAASPKRNYTFRVFRIGEITISSVTIDGNVVDLADALNKAPYSAIFNQNIYTKMPEVEAKLIDGTIVKGKGTLNGTEAIYTINGKMGEQTRTYQLTIGGIHIYNKGENDEMVTLKYTGAGITNNGWSNGLYSISRIGDGWENSSFKMDAGSYTLSVPANVVVKQLIFKDFNANYNGGELTNVSSQGAKMWIPTKHDYQEPDATMYDLIINMEGHEAGQPITFTLNGGGQPVAWFEMLVEQVTVASAPILKNTRVTSTTNKNHCVVELTFDREMKGTEAEIISDTNTRTTVKAEGGSAILSFAIWNLAYNSQNTFLIATGSAKDTYGNTNTEPISINIQVGNQAEVKKATYDYIVSNVSEWKKALSAVNASNGSNTATRKIIFVRNGDYDFGSEEQSLKAYNVSIIGESRDGVILHGNRDGISNPVLNINNTGGNYLQDFTIRNDKDFGKARSGVGVAISGGKKVIMKNIAMQSQQDTQVTGESGYYLNCKIYGAVDYICGGGNHFYDQCELIMTNPGPITAPATSSMLKWGYVFQHCTVNEYPNFKADKNYDLGRPWQNEPRAYFLNTRMNVLPSDAGWRSMSTLPTHFYEYKSIDKNGNLIDLSTRKNSPTSTNQYTPILTDEQANLFTVENVLGGSDSWLPTEEAITTKAPQVNVNGKTLTWDDVEGARCYVIFLNGNYLDNVIGNSYQAPEEGTYTIRSANLNGGLGESSEIIVEDTQEPTTLKEKTPAFPGAEGYGRYVTGGRGGTVYHVTNLNDSGTGSFRWACEQSGTRTIVFDVSGTIHLKSELKLRNGNVTIAGQTAPGDGICVADWGFIISAPNVIIRYMRFRPGDTSEGEPDGLSGFDGKNIIIDHCSVSWSVDECLSVYGNEHMTVQWCLISQSLRHSTHAKDAHGYGGNWGGKGATYHHNLLAHHDSRTPRLANRPMYVQQDTTDLRNNVYYNWAGNGCYGGEGMKVNIVNCYYKPGPGTMQSKSGRNATRIAGLGITTKETDGSYMIWGKYFIDGNVNPNYPTVTKDNWGVGVYPHISDNTGTYTSTTKDTMRLREPLNFMYVTTHTAERAYEKVLQYAGASLHRDEVDDLVVSDTRNGKATYTGKGSGDVYGIIDTPFDIKPIDADDDWNPWPILTSIAAPKDTDGDGMPDEWELVNGLNPNDKNDGIIRNEEGYTHLECYLNSLVEHITVAQNEDGEPMGYQEYASEEDITGALIIPTEALNLDKAEITINTSGKKAAKVLNDSFDSFSHGDKATFLLNCKETGTYTFNFDAATTRSDFKLRFQITDNTSGKIEVDKTISITNTGNWQSYRNYSFDTAEMKQGVKTLTMTWQSSNGQYTGNVKNIAVIMKEASAIHAVDISGQQEVVLYNLQGQRMTGNVPAGIYIKNGKKVIIK
ncbi:MAG: hypothetical protein IJL54_14415 [Prevotella sp.]|nr:hypothetical protein [Prevotella sp.]